jgi:anthranilate phosphoribosyltransferase
VIVLNAGAAIYVSGKAKTIEEGVRLAGESISSGAALGALEDFVHTTRLIGGIV